MRDRLLGVLSTLAAAVAPLGASACDENHLPAPVADEVLPISFATSNGWQYDGRIELPPKERRRDWAVMMLGGGLGGSIDWLVPGVLTLDGNPTRDGDTIAGALLHEGFVVMRWHAIRRGDPQHAKDPLMMDAPPFLQTAEQAKMAFEEFRKSRVVPEDHVFLLGHSLGARRACILLEEHPRIAGVVMLAGAELIPSDLDAARKVLQDPPDDSPKPEIEEPKLANVHERRVHRLEHARERWSRKVAEAKDRWDHRFPADLLVETKSPTLLLVGALDERWLVESYLFTVYLRERNHPDYAWRVFDNLGHNLGPELPGAVTYGDQGEIADSRTGPIDPEVVQDLVQWISKRAR